MNKEEVLRILDKLHYSLKDTVKKYGYNCLKKEQILEMKELLNRKKDKEDIEILKKYT